MIYSKKLRWSVAQWFERRWWKSYLKDKSPASYLAWKRNYWFDFLEKIGVSLSSSDVVLDAGCGPAGIFTVLNGNEVVAIDPLLPSYEKMGLLVQSSFENVRFEAAHIEELRHIAKFDVVFCINAINHVQDLSKSLRSLSQAAKPSATMVITTDCHRFNFYKLLFRLIPLDILHPHQFSELEYIAAIEKHQIRVVRKVQLQQNHFFKYMAFVCEKI